MKTPTIKDIRAAAAARRSRRERQRRWLIGLIVSIVAVGILSVFVLPPWVRGQVETRMGEALQRPVQVERVKLNPFTLAATLEHVAIADFDGALFARWDRLVVNVDALALVRGIWGFDRIELEGFEGRVAIDAAGELNFADLLTSLEAGERESAPPDVSIRALVVREAKVDFFDASREVPFSTTLGPMSFTLEDFRTEHDAQAPYDFKATTEAGESLRWTGQLSAAPLRSAGSIEVGGLQLAKYAPYYADLIGFEVRDGRIKVQGDYLVDLSGNTAEVRFTDAKIDMTALQLGKPEESAPVMRAEGIEIEGLNFDLRSRMTDIDRVAWVGGDLTATRTTAGVDWMELLGEEAADEASSVEAQPWGTTIDTLSLESVNVRWLDQSLPVPAEVTFTPLQLTLRNIDLANLDATVSVGLSATMETGGELKVSGETSVQPFRPALAVDATGLDMTVFGGYVAEAAGYHLDRGRLTMKGQVGVAGEALVFRGTTQMAGARLSNVDGEPLVGWENLHIGGIDFISEPMALEVASVRWIRPDVALEIDAEGSSNWSARFASSRAELSEPAIPLSEDLPTSSPPSVVRVNLVEVVEARIEFRDTSLADAVELSVDALSGELTGLSSVEMAKGRADLQGKINGVAPVAIAGDFNPLGRPAYTDMKIDFERIDLVPVDGYIGKYAGYELQRGRLSLDVDFKLADRRVSSESIATLDDFTLGKKVSSSDATNLPVALAVTLLKDTKGQIVIDMPVAGSLDDPEFRIGRVVWRVITNLLTKVATSPFALLGAIAGGGETEDLDHQSFVAGETRLKDAAIAKLDTVALALHERPGLVLNLVGEADASADAVALRPQVLEAQLRAAASSEQFKTASGWQAGGRETVLMNHYLTVFGVPPIDPDRAAPLPAVAVAAMPEEVTMTEQRPEVVAAVDETLLGWIKRVFNGSSTSAAGAEVENTAEIAIAPVEAPSPPVFAALPVAEVEARLVSQIEVSEDRLLELAHGRAQVVAAFLETKGLLATRLNLEAPKIGEAQVVLTLR